MANSMEVYVSCVNLKRLVDKQVLANLGIVLQSDCVGVFTHQFIQPEYSEMRTEEYNALVKTIAAKIGDETVTIDICGDPYDEDCTDRKYIVFDNKILGIYEQMPNHDDKWYDVNTQS